MPKSYDLPSLGDLACFEAAARHLSFKKAASELNVTPAAVSHRIRALEEELAQTLFTRQYRGVELTEAGTLLFVALQRGFDTISESVTRIRTFTDQSGVTIAATTAVSSLWLTRRLAMFITEHSDISVSQIVQDGDFPLGPDLSIIYGNPELEEDITLPLFGGRIIALGTQEFAKNWYIHSIEDLVQCPLIHTQTANQSWTTWSEWFATFGITAPIGKGHVMNNYLISFQAAENNIGAVLGWEALLADHLSMDGLVQLVPEAIDAPFQFYIRIHAGASEKTRMVADYLVSHI